MDRIREELEIYKTVASMTGAILYRYDIAADRMEFIFGRCEASKYGSTINNYVQMLYRQRSTGQGSRINVEDLIQGLKSPERGYFECEARMSNFTTKVKWYSVIGKTVYDDNNEPQYIIGKMTELEDTAVSGTDSAGDNVSYDIITGLLNKKGILNKLSEKCGELCGAEAAFAEFKIEIAGNGRNSDNENPEISIAQYLKRKFAYNAYLGRGDKGEFYVLYCGEISEKRIVSYFEDLKDDISDIVRPAGNEAVVNGGIYVGPFNAGREHDIAEKAHMSLLKAKYYHPGSVVRYSDEIDMEINESRRRLENVEFDHKLVESALEIMSGSGNIGEAIRLIFDRIGQKYGLDRIAVQELDSHSKTTKVTYSWITAKHPDIEGRILKERLVDYEDLKVIYGQKEITVVSDTKSMADHKFYSKIQATGLKSFVQCIFTGSHHISGCVSFECFGNRHEWNDTEIKTFKMISQLVSSFLLNMREYEEMLNVRASFETHDPLTGLYKYKAFKQEADQYIKYDKDNKLAVVYAGIKNFLSVNARFGYEVGDDVLREYARILSDDKRFIMGCRINADNVVALFKVYDEQGNRISASAISRINYLFSSEYEHKCPGMDITIIAGIAEITDIEKPLNYYIDKALSARGRAANNGLDGLVAD